MSSRTPHTSGVNQRVASFLHPVCSSETHCTGASLGGNLRARHIVIRPNTQTSKARFMGETKDETPLI